MKITVSQSTGRDYFEFEWFTGVVGLLAAHMPVLDELCVGRWGYRFIHEDGAWYKYTTSESQLVLGFELEEDRLRAMLTIVP